jgi:hypothetical protein
VRRFVVVALLVAVARFAFGQGGPPMITDDPGTPGNGKWENNIAIAVEHRPGEWLLDTPQLDLNYGWGDHIQLNLQTAYRLLKQNDHGGVGGLGDTQLAVKWRFLDEEQSGFDVSTYPRVLFNIFQSSVRRGLADDGTRFRVPIEIAKKFGRIEVDTEIGALVGTAGRSEWLSGFVVGTELTKKTEVMAELYATARNDFSQDTLVLDVGWRYELNKHAIWIASIGHELRSPDPLAWVGYCGVQLLY